LYVGVFERPGEGVADLDVAVLVEEDVAGAHVSQFVIGLKGLLSGAGQTEQQEPEILLGEA
jgi:hypothetical protein